MVKEGITYVYRKPWNWKIYEKLRGVLLQLYVQMYKCL